jgi:hypothetical protein
MEEFLKENGFIKVKNSDTFFNPHHCICVRKDIYWSVFGFGLEGMKHVDYWRKRIAKVSRSIEC